MEELSVKTVTRGASFQNFPLRFRRIFDYLNLINAYCRAGYISSEERER
jgi:hypothetical protein